MSKKHEEPDEPVHRPKHGEHPDADKPGGPSPDHDLPTKPGRPGHPDHDLPEKPTVDPHGIIKPGDLPKPGEMVGVVHFENAAGGDNGRARYRVPPTLRERVLIWRHQRHEQNHVNGDGEWVYRLDSTSGVGTVARDADLEAIDPEDGALAPEPQHARA
jgi:hypothetical protein